MEMKVQERKKKEISVEGTYSTVSISLILPEKISLTV